MKLTIAMQKERETKGTFRYQEVNAETGLPVGQASMILGTLYIRKSSLANGVAPQVLNITLEG